MAKHFISHHIRHALCFDSSRHALYLTPYSAPTLSRSLLGKHFVSLSTRQALYLALYSASILSRALICMHSIRYALYLTTYSARTLSHSLLRSTLSGAFWHALCLALYSASTLSRTLFGTHFISTLVGTHSISYPIQHALYLDSSLVLY